MKNTTLCTLLLSLTVGITSCISNGARDIPWVAGYLRNRNETGCKGVVISSNSSDSNEIRSKADYMRTCLGVKYPTTTNNLVGVEVDFDDAAGLTLTYCPNGRKCYLAKPQEPASR